MIVVETHNFISKLLIRFDHYDCLILSYQIKNNCMESFDIILHKGSMFKIFNLLITRPKCACPVRVKGFIWQAGQCLN